MEILSGKFTVDRGKNIRWCFFPPINCKLGSTSLPRDEKDKTAGRVAVFRNMFALPG